MRFLMWLWQTKRQCRTPSLPTKRIVLTFCTQRMCFPAPLLGCVGGWDSATERNHAVYFTKHKHATLNISPLKYHTLTLCAILHPRTMDHHTLRPNYNLINAYLARGHRIMDWCTHCRFTRISVNCAFWGPETRIKCKICHIATQSLFQFLYCPIHSYGWLSIVCIVVMQRGTQISSVPTTVTSQHNEVLYVAPSNFSYDDFTYTGAGTSYPHIMSSITQIAQTWGYDHINLRVPLCA